MKTFSNLLLRLLATLLPLSLIILTNCSSSDEELPALASVVAKFDYDLSNEGVAPSTVTFTNTSIAATSYVWNFGIEGETSTDENPEFTYEEFGTFDVTLIARADDDRADTTTQTIVIKDPLGGKKPTLYYTDRATGQIHMIILDDDAETPIIQTFGENHTKPYGIVADLDNENLYVVDQADELMYQYDALVKGEKSVILNVADLGEDDYMMYYPAGVKVIEGRLYWGAEGGIYTSALDGSDLKPFVEFSTATGALEGSLPLGISYDAENEVIYFANDAYDYSGGVYKVNMDGTGLEEIIPGVDAGDISYLDGKLYYFDFITAKGTIYEIATKTTVEFVDYPVEFVWGTIADPITKRVYWTDRGTNDDGTDGKIMSANLDGSDIKVVLDIDNAPVVGDVKTLRPYALALGLF